MTKRYETLRVHYTPPLCALLTLCVAPLASAATSVTQHGITWTFDRDYPSGQFANGDHWVVGPVKIVAISPKTLAAHGGILHGSMVNPVANGPQAYDSRIKHNRFAADLNVASRLPLVLAAGSSLLSSESHAPRSTGHNPQIRTIAILTVLDAPAPTGSFRPPYVGGDKTLRWNVSQLQYDRLRSLPRVRYAPTPAQVAPQFERPWIEQGTTWVARYLHPGDNQPGYGREIAHAVARAALTLQLDYPLEEKKTLLVRFLQYGIDIYGAARAGGVWTAGGGHNHGRKLPLLLAGTMLDDEDMLAYADGQRQLFQEDRQTWYVTLADVGRLLYLTDGRSRLPYLPSDVGLAEWGEQHADWPNRDARNWNAYYRTVAGGSTIGHVLAARLMNLEDEWNWPAIFDYYDRYWAMESGNAGRGANAIQGFVAEMWKAYRHAKVAELSDKTVATSQWQNTAVTPQTGTFTVAFDLLPSGNRIDGVTGLSSGGADRYTDLAAGVRFSPAGVIDVRDGSNFRALQPFPYEAGVRYRILLTVDIPRGRYSASVARPNAAPVLLAANWRFRTEQRGVKQLDSVGFFASSGYHAVMNVSLQPEGAPLALAGTN